MRRRPDERGAALVCALVLMLAAMLVGVSITHAAFAAIASALAERERGMARACADAALLDAERDIAANFAGADPARAAQFAAGGTGAFVEGCGHGGAGLGLCQATSPPAWQLQDLADPGNPSLVPYGYYTGARLAAGGGLLPARPPAYLIERIAPPGAAPSLGSFYRITAIGFGSQEAVRVVLQSVVRKPGPAPEPPPGTGPPGGAGEDPGGQAGRDGNGNGNGQGNGPAAPASQLPAGRISWREIGNWPRLHADAAG